MEHDQERIAWHPAFREIMRAELDGYQDIIEFHDEYPLTTEPLRMDMLIIKKLKDVVIEKNIARIFLEHNIIEYKSPEDSLSIEDFFKAASYACLYAALEKIRTRGITLTFIQTGHPRGFLNFLGSEMGCAFEPLGEGIHMTHSLWMPMQIIESDKLDETENLWLKNLSKRLDSDRIAYFMGLARSKDMKAFLSTILRANPTSLREVERTMPTTFREVMEEIGLADFFRQQGEQTGKLEAAIAMLKDHLTQEQVARYTGLPLAEIQALQAGS